MVAFHVGRRAARWQAAAACGSNASSSQCKYFAALNVSANVLCMAFQRNFENCSENCSVKSHPLDMAKDRSGCDCMS